MSERPTDHGLKLIRTKTTGHTAAELGDLTAQANQPDTQPATAHDVGGFGLKICIRPHKLDFWEFEGTRAQLEAEDVIPPGTEWPEGARDQRWEAGRFRYWLRRCRPDGMKGPMKLWTSGDWWCLRCDLVNGPDHATSSILQKKAELVVALYRQSPAGQLAWQDHWTRYCNARQDKAFQSFKGVFMPERRKPGCKPKAQAPEGTQQ
jgi:hypothetical protein